VENTGRSKHLAAPLRLLLLPTTLSSIVGTRSTLRTSLGSSSSSSTSIAGSLRPLSVSAIARSCWPCRPPITWSWPPTRFLAASEQTGDPSEDALQQVQLPVDDVSYGPLLAAVLLAALHPVARVQGEHQQEADQGHQVQLHLD